MGQEGDRRMQSIINDFILMYKITTEEQLFAHEAFKNHSTEEKERIGEWLREGKINLW